MNLREFTAMYPPQPSRREPANPDEMRLLGEADGVRILAGSPAEGEPGHASDFTTRHLWVFAIDNAPYILESAPRVVPKLKSGVAKHSNLTGGAAAACGGELWIDIANPAHLFVNGASGRYGPTTKRQLEDAVEVFKSCGFEVTSFGWNEETQTPYTVLYR